MLAAPMAMVEGVLTGGKLLTLTVATPANRRLIHAMPNCSRAEEGTSAATQL
jgi:hypothetical protein